MANYQHHSTSDMLAARLKQLSAARPNRASVIEPLSKDDKISHMLGHQPLNKQSSTPSPTLEQMRQEEMERAKSTLLALEANNYQQRQQAASNWETLFAAPNLEEDANTYYGGELPELIVTPSGTKVAQSNGTKGSASPDDYYNFKPENLLQHTAGFMRLKKQGGKLVEVWTPFN